MFGIPIYMQKPNLGTETAGPESRLPRIHETSRAMRGSRLQQPDLIMVTGDFVQTVESREKRYVH